MADTDFFTDSERLKPLPSNLLGKLLKQKAYERQGKLLDALTKVGTSAIYIVPSILSFLYVLVLLHKAWINEWGLLEESLKSMMIPVTTYLAGMLSKNVLLKNQNQVLE